MQTAAINKNPKDGGLSTPKSPRSTFQRIISAPYFASLFIFAFAFLLRYLYNAVFMEHRIAHFGDAYNFLRSGTCLFEAAVKSHSPMEFFAQIYHAAAPQAQLLQSMTSMKLTDRLLIDGPVYPAYLALIEWISGVNALNPIFDSHTVQISLCNSFIDALSCVLVYVCGRLAFNRRVAIVAGLLFSIYPAAIINTQHCYSEPFTYFLVNAWTALVLFALLRHNKSKWSNAATWAGIGLTSGLMMLSKPAFIMLPPMVTAAIVPVSLFRLAKLNSGNTILAAASRYSKKILLAFLGAVIVLTPWVFFNKAASGQYSVFVNRVPSFNIFHGNQIGTDAWRCYPFYGTFPGDSTHVIASLLNDAKQEPLVFIGLQFKKVARLWSGVWNEYHYSLFGINLDVQNLLHQILLFSGVLSLSFLLFRSNNKTLSRSFSAALVLGTIVLFHFAYIPFEAISRYAITAMPAIALLSAAFYVECWNRKATKGLIALIATAAVSFLAISQSAVTANWLAGLMPPAQLHAAVNMSVALSCLALLVCVLLGFGLLKQLNGKDSKAMRILPAAFALLAAAVTGFYTIQSHDWKEWQASINSRQSARQTIWMPATASELKSDKTAFVLLDLSAQTLSPPIELTVNGHTINEPPIPLAQLQPNNADILQCLAIQGEGMGLDLRSFRNWWVVPFPASYLQRGDNGIELNCKDDLAKVVVYGDYIRNENSKSDGTCYLPSLRSFSYTKGFTTFDHRDPRVFEKIELHGKAMSSRHTDQSSAIDLSDSAGTQFGRYRIRVIMPESNGNNQELPAAKTTQNLSKFVLVPRNQAQLVDGRNPASFVPENKVIDLPAGLPPGTRFNFGCEIRSLTSTRPYFVSLTFTGTDPTGQSQTWSSKWQPIAIMPSKTFRSTTFSDTIPSEVLSLKNLQIHPMFSPFQPDYLFLKQKQAIKSKIEIRDANLTFLPSLDLPPIEKRSWTVF